MIGINCLLRNTALKNDLRNLVEYMGYERVANDKDPSLTGIYSDLQKAGVEVDLRTVGALYKDALSAQSERFTRPEDIDKITGRQTEATIRNLMLQKPLEGEERIGKMPPEEFIANGLMRAFHSNIVEDTRTKSVMRTLQDAAYRQAQRMVGDLPNEKVHATPEQWQETIQKALELDKTGYNTLEGTMNNAHTLFDGMQKEMAKHSSEINGTHDDVLRGQWNDYIKSFEDATYSLLLSKEQAMDVVHGTLIDAGYGKQLKDGRTILDRNKLAGGINDVGQLRDNVRSVLENKGYDPGTAERIADSLQKEFHEMRGEILNRHKQNNDRLQESWNKLSPTDKKDFDLNTLINDRLKSWDNYKQLSGDGTKELQFSKGEAQNIIKDALKSEGYGKQVAGGKVVMDWTKLAGGIKDASDIRGKVEELLQRKGYDDRKVHQVVDAIQGKYEDIRQDILDHAKNKLDKMQDNVRNPPDATKTKADIQNLGELHDLGIFDGAHEDLLNHVVGLNGIESQDMYHLAEIGKMAASLARDVNGKNFLATPLFQKFQHDVKNIVNRNIADKTKLLKSANAISQFFKLENMGIIGNAFNLLENNLSGAKENFATNLGLFKKMGFESVYNNRKLFSSTWKHIAAEGGAEYGQVANRFGGDTFVGDHMNVGDLSKEDLKDPKKFPKIFGAIVLAPAKAGLNASDGAIKATNHMNIMKFGLHKALTDGGMDKSEASALLNNALYGKSLDDARTQAKDMLEKYQQKATPAAIERLANNLVIQNLNSDGRLSDEVIQAAYESSYQIASLGMGHTANNFFSKALEGAKTKAAKTEADLIKKEDWGTLGRTRIWNTFVYDGLLRFLGGGANWAVLRLQSGFGLGLASAYLGKFKPDTELNFDSPEKLKDSMTGYLKAQSDVNRALVGISFLAANVGLVYAYGANRQKEKDEDKNENALESAYKGIEGNYVGRKLLTKVGADLILFHYMAETSKVPNHQYLDAAFKYSENNFNIGNKSSPTGLIESSHDALKYGGRKGWRKAMGDIGQIAGGMVEVPFARSYKQAYKLFDYAVTGSDPTPKYKQPMSVMEGMFGGGMAEDIGLYKRHSPIEVIPGVGDKLALQAAKDGINTVDDLRNHPDWLQHNLSSKKLEKAQKVYNELYGGDKPVKNKIKDETGTAGGGASGVYEY